MGVPPFLDHPGPLAFAHRGGARGGAAGVEGPAGATIGAPVENTMPAFAAAVALGYRYLETDVHATADGVLVAFHDDRLDRVTDRTGRIEDLPWREVRRALVGGREPIPLLEDLLGAWPEARLNVDAKHDRAVAPLAEVVRRTGAGDRVCVAAFSDRRLARLRAALGPEVCTAAGPRAIAALRATSLVGRGRRGAAACVQVPPRVGRLVVVDRRFVAAAHRAGLAVHVWTIDEPDEMHRLLDLGVDGLMTDRPAVLKAVLQARGQWPG
jgi:glycerophosphoryl diester phosphodiesterase